MSEALETVTKFGQLMKAAPHDEESVPAWVDQILRFLDPDIHIPVAGALPYGGDWHGHEGFLQMGAGFADTWNVIDGGTFKYDEISDNKVLLRVDPTFQSRKTGKTVSFIMVEILTVRDGKITELVPYYFDTAELVATFTT